MINSVASEGLKGMQSAQRDMQRAASDIAKAGVNVQPDSQVETQQPADDLLRPVGESAETQRTQDLAEPLIELRRQEQLFTASAKIVSVADDALGSLLDVKS